MIIMNMIHLQEYTHVYEGASTIAKYSEMLHNDCFPERWYESNKSLE